MFKGVVNFSVFRLDPEDKYFAELVKNYRINGLGKNKPKLRYYPNGVTEDSKL